MLTLLLAIIAALTTIAVFKLRESTKKVDDILTGPEGTPCSLIMDDELPATFDDDMRQTGHAAAARPSPRFRFPADPGTGPRHPIDRSSQKPDPRLYRLAGQPYVTDLLDVLVSHPATHDELRHRVHTSQRTVSSALRMLASEGALRRLGTQGSWDTIGSDDARYELTALGHQLSSQLDRFETWNALYEYYLY